MNEFATVIVNQGLAVGITIYFLGYYLPKIQAKSDKIIEENTKVIAEFMKVAERCDRN